MNMHKLFSILALLLGLASVSLNAQAESKTAVFAGGCFWCMQPPYDTAKGVTKTVVGYTGGTKETANYELVSAHKTQHREAIEVTYDPAQISYDQLLDIFWHNIRPTQADGQFHEILPRTPLYPAEDYHQKYYLKSPGAFETYHVGSGRVSYLQGVWGK